MDRLVIIGAGGFGREVKWLVERLNARERERSGKERWEFLGFVDDGITRGTIISGYPVLGDTKWLKGQKGELAAVCAVGCAKTRRKIIDFISENKIIRFPNLIDPSTLTSGQLNIGKGNIICAGTILTVDITIHDFCIINLDCTIGHDTKIESCTTIYPSANLSGCVTVGAESEIGTGCHIIQGVVIGRKAILGAGTVVIRDIPECCTAVGNPARIIK